MTYAYPGLRLIAGPEVRVQTGQPRLRVLQITNMYPRASRPNYGVFIRSQIESLAVHGVACDIIEITGDQSRWSYLAALLLLPQLARSQPYDLMHVHFGYSALSTLGIRHLPQVISFCGSDLYGHNASQGQITRSSRVLSALSRWAARRADAVIVKSQAMAAALGQGYAAVTVLPNGVDPELFTPIPRDEARSELGWPTDTPIALFPADAMDPRKNVALARAVQARLQAEGWPVRLEVLYGRPQADIVLAMSAADVLLSCSLQEGSPNVVKEAMAMNLPVVATDVGDCAERLHGVFPGAVVATTVEDFTAATRAILQQSGVRSNGRERLEGLDVDAIALRLMTVYRQAIQHFNAEGRVDVRD